MSSENGVPVELLKPLPTLWTFNLRQPVKIKPLDGWDGLVLARADYGNHHKYLVLWWFNSERHEEWLQESELEVS